MISPFNNWTKERSEAAVSLASGATQAETALLVGVTPRTIRYWVADPDFSAEVDRLSLMVSIASRAERLREVMRVLKKRRDADGTLTTDRDSLDWLKFAQSETDGAKIDFGKLTEALTQAEEQLSLTRAEAEVVSRLQLNPAQDIVPTDNNTPTSS